MNKQTDHSRAAVPGAASATALSGRHEQKGRTFAPLTISQSSQSSEDEASKAPSSGRAVPIGRPLPDSVYERLKEEAETEPPDPAAPKGHQDQSVTQSGRHEQRGQTFSPRMISRESSEDEASKAPSSGRAVPIGRPLPDSVYKRLKEEAETELPNPSAPKGHKK
jgi:hypothetical protein